MALYLLLVSVFLATWLAGRFLVSFSKRSRRAPYPPGPPPKPLIGNALDFPPTQWPETFLAWGKKYRSDLVYASALGNKILVLNKLEDADELLDRRARIYSDRPEMPVVKLMGWSFNVASQRYGPTWRLHRQIAHQHFRAEAARKYYPLLIKKAHEMLVRLLEEPEKFDEHNKMYSISIPMITMYGYHVESFNDPCVVAADEAFTLGTTLVLPGGAWMNIIPALAHIPPWFPGATASKLAAKVKRLTEEVERIPLEFVTKAVESGAANDSFIADFLRKKRDIGASEEEETAVRNIANTVYSAASDTTIASIGAFFYFMAMYPDVQRKAQEEIERVIGPHRLPTFEDRASLPYIDAIYKENLRLAPPVPLGAPHATTEDDHYKGYFIPKGTTVFANIWAMSRDEEKYSEPLKFKPERFLDENGRLDSKHRVLGYGFGRRICVGRYIASASTWIVMASVLACFNIEKSKDESGTEIEIQDDFDDFGVIRHKSKFQCSFVPRSAMVEKLINENK